MKPDSHEDIVNELQSLIDAGEELRNAHYRGTKWQLWEDKAHRYLKRLDEQAATEFHNRIHEIIDAPEFLGDAGRPARALQKAIVYLTVIKARAQDGEYGSARKVTLIPIPHSIFIAHSGEPPALSRLADFLKALGVEPVIAERLPFKGRQVPDQARSAMNGCAAAIVFATAADAATDRTRPGRGLLNETGVLQERFDDKVIYLVEKGVKLGPMLDSFARASFTQDCLERAFHRIVLELRAHRII